MRKVWYCATCGYEVGSRGRCHSCREKLIPSELPELEPADDEDDEVGYRIGSWADSDRGRLIEYLNVMQISHRFEDEELVVLAEDEARVDDLLEELSLNTAPGGHVDASDSGEHPVAAPGSDDSADLADAGSESVRLLVDAARRLMSDPTDMEADADVAEASTGVFMEEQFYGTDAETWAAVGRVTRRLLVALGAEEAMEEEIRLQASILNKLLSGVEEMPSESASDSPPSATGALGVGTVYELPEWLPEQRSHLSVLLDQHSIPHEWDADDLVVATAREADAEALFDQVGAPPISDAEYDEDDETRYRALEELFNAAVRLASEPDDAQRQHDLEDWAAEVDGPAPVGMDEIHWLRIINKSHALCEALQSEADDDAVAGLAGELHELLRTVV